MKLSSKKTNLAKPFVSPSLETYYPKNNMKKSYLSVLTILFLLCTSCATKTLWEASDPDEYVKIKFTDITEQELIGRGAKYYKDDQAKMYYVNKDSQEILKDYTIRVLATPFTVAIDATTVVIFGMAMGFTENAIDDYVKENNIDDHRVDPDENPHGPGRNKS